MDALVEPRSVPLAPLRRLAFEVLRTALCVKPLWLGTQRYVERARVLGQCGQDAVAQPDRDTWRG